MGQLLVGRYRLGRVIGSGGMASVYEAEDVTLGRRVAIKVMHPQYALDQSFVARFDREARAIAGLNHPGVVGVFDVGRDDTQYFIVMELLESRSVKDLVRNGPLSIDQTIDIGAQVAKALDHAHRAGVVHRDVKAQNILVSREGQAKLVDFGIAVAKGSASVTEAGNILGTVHYIAPEQARGEAATPASDLYSLGVVLYEMATGRLPFEGESPIEIATKHVGSSPRPPRQVNPSLPIDLERAILHAMEKEPRNRPAAGSDLARELLDFDQLYRQETRYVPTPAASDPRSERLGLARDRYPLPSEASVFPLVLLAILALLLVTGLFPLWAALLQSGRV